MNTIKLLFTLLTLTIFSLSSVQAQTTFEFDTGGQLEASAGLPLGDFAFRSEHGLATQFIMRTANGIQRGKLVGSGNNFGLMTKANNWVFRADLTQTELLVNGVGSMTLLQGGKVQIGDLTSTPGNYKLYVEDGILAERVRVALSTAEDWADYVFEDDFELMPIDEVDGFIKKNNHLPNVPSAAEMVEKGLDVLESDAILLRKIEEAYLYIIDQNERIAKLEAQVNNK